ncbi:unnamed protein product [marine sediment metagenome]|uniref:C2H2-type domain-containing protein n=1 Tax=marine sediment metagenome TaxID=412755 RepID=X1MNQ7_9ZZZZ
MNEVMCPVCAKNFNSFLNLAKHMVLKDRPIGEHIQWLEQFLCKPFTEFGWGSDKKIAIALRNYWVKHRGWPIALAPGITQSGQ